MLNATARRHASDPRHVNHVAARFRLVDLDEHRGRSGTTVSVRGVASVYSRQYDVYGGPAAGGWLEEVMPGAFHRTLARQPDVPFLVNHGGIALARTTSGTLRLAAGVTGLDIEADLDRRQPSAADLLIALERGDVSQMSFAFRCAPDDQEWGPHPKFPGDPEALRKLYAVDINGGDVSAVNFGASPTTTIGLAPAAEPATAGRSQWVPCLPLPPAPDCLARYDRRAPALPLPPKLW